MKQQSVYTGSCLCGQVTYEIEGPIGRIMHCHCGRCRKWHGAAFRTRASVRRSDFRFTGGEALLSRFKSRRVERTFCATCGSNLASYYRAFPSVVGIALGTLDQDPGRRPEGHLFVESKAPWHDITDDLPRYEEMPDDPTEVYRVDGPLTSTDDDPLDDDTLQLAPTGPAPAASLTNPLTDVAKLLREFS